MAFVYFDPGYAPCAFLIVRDGASPYDERNTVLVQTDWDWPGVASRMGWAPCHGETDGTIDCPVCGRTASDMIQAAGEYITAHAGSSYPDLDEHLPAR